MAVILASRLNREHGRSTRVFSDLCSAVNLVPRMHQLTTRLPLNGRHRRPGARLAGHVTRHRGCTDNERCCTATASVYLNDRLVEAGASSHGRQPAAFGGEDLSSQNRSSSKPCGASARTENATTGGTHADTAIGDRVEQTNQWYSCAHTDGQRIRSETG